MLNNFYKVIYNFYVSKNEKDIPHIYAVALMSVLEIFNALTIVMIINMFKEEKEFIITDREFSIKLGVAITIFNFIYYHKYANRNVEIFNIEKNKRKLFLIFFFATIGIWD